MLAVKKGQVWEVFDPTVGYWDKAIVVAVENDHVTLRHQTGFQRINCSIEDLEQRRERFRYLAEARPA
jgi:hypothetical protein